MKWLLFPQRICRSSGQHTPRRGVVQETAKAAKAQHVSFHLANLRPAIRRPCQRPDRELAHATIGPIVEVATEPELAVFFENSGMARTNEWLFGVRHHRPATI